MLIMADRTLDASGLRCPKLELNSMTPGEELVVVATDTGSLRDIPAWLALSAHTLVSQSESNGEYRFVIKCGG